MKLSIYVPDDLWQAAHGRLGGKQKNPSQVVQEALRQYVRGDESRTRALAEGIQVDRKQFQAVLAKLLKDARSEFERGYRAGLELAAELNFDRLAEAVHYYDLDLSQMFANWDPAWAELEVWYRKYSDETDPGLDDRYEVFQRGVQHALRDIWIALEEASWGAPGRKVSPEATEPATE